MFWFGNHSANDSGVKPLFIHGWHPPHRSKEWQSSEFAGRPKCFGDGIFLASRQNMASNTEDVIVSFLNWLKGNIRENAYNAWWNHVKSMVSSKIVVYSIWRPRIWSGGYKTSHWVHWNAMVTIVISNSKRLQISGSWSLEVPKNAKEISRFWTWFSSTEAI